MKKALVTFLGLAVASGMLRAAEQPELKDQMDKVSYGIGMNLGMQFLRSEVDIRPEQLLEGMKAVLEGRKTVMTEEEMRKTLTDYQQETRNRMMEKRRQLGEKNREEGEAFLAENKAKPGVVTLPSGLQYQVLVEGEGTPPKSNDVVHVRYRGTLIDGTEFDSSYSRGEEPATFTVNRLIKGWTEALQLMKPGSKWRLFIPGDLAYGERGSGSKIGPNAALIFETELVSVDPIPDAPKPPTNKPVTSDILRVPSKEEMAKGAKVEVLKKEDVERILQEERAKQQKEQTEKKD